MHLFLICFTLLCSVFRISMKLDIYEDFPILYKKIYFNHDSQKIMAYSMVKKSLFIYPSKRYLDVIKQGYKDCKLDIKYLEKALRNF